MREKPQDLENCETFLRAILAFAGEQASNVMWEECRRHEWYNWEWNTIRGEIVRKDENSNY